MKLSIVMPTFNKVKLLQQALAALARQNLDPSVAWEIVVVNDGSTDTTAHWLTTANESLPVPLNVVSPNQNVGRAKARNLGAQAATGQWILFLDDDIVAPEGLLAAHLSLLESNPGFGTIGYAVTEPTVVDAPHFSYLDSRGVAKLSPGCAPGRFFVTQNAAVPRQAFMDVGGFDESFTGYGFEDMEVAFRLEDKAGLQFMALTEPVPVHVHHHSLAEYWSKKVECGRDTLPRLARLHPHRIPEMNLHYVVDWSGQKKVPCLGRFIRRFARSALGRRFPFWLDRWPCDAQHRPLAAKLYYRFMNLAVLCCFAQGLSETSD